MNGTQIMITVLYSAVTLIGIVGMLAVLRSTRRKGEPLPESTLHKLHRGENWWALMALVILIVFFVATFFGVPWLNRAQADTTANVRALQFAFIVQPAQIPAGTVDFKVKSDDVSHGFGLYAPDGKLVKQIQVLPGVTSTMTVDLDTPGTYKILCLEFCGYNHHNMVGQFEVTP